MPILTVRHLTTYRYSEPVRFGEHRMMFRPREAYDQRILDAKLTVGPEPTSLRYTQDVFGNTVAFADFKGARPADTLSFESEFTLEHSPSFPSLDQDLAIAGEFPFAYNAEDMPDLLRCIERRHHDPEGRLERWARRLLKPRGSTGVLELLSDMTKAIHRDFRYIRRLEGGCQDPLETLRLGGGSCRDFAMLMIEAVRSLGLAARFVSGYIYTPPRAGEDRKGGGHTHAWVRVYLPSCGWVEFDPTNGIVGSEGLVRVAVARDPRQAIPLSGVWNGRAGAFVGMEVEVDVRAETDRTEEAVAA
jgi:transglutaminase-like putative cysteine protease